MNGRELVEGTIAAEAGLVDRTVSFTKGCFTGQELVARLDARGSKVARRLCGVVVDRAGDGPGSEAELVGATVVTADREHEVGHLSSVAWSPGLSATVALGTLHRRVAPPEPVSVAWRDGGGRHEVGGGGPSPAPRHLRAGVEVRPSAGNGVGPGRERACRSARSEAA